MHKQTGLLYAPPKPEDYMLGGETPIVHEDRLSYGDWTQYLPAGERQKYTFDTLSCTTFSALNVIETQLKWFVEENKLPETHIKFLKDEGFLIDGKVDISDRFTAISSGTTDNGNYLYKVMDSIRKEGILPEKDFPFTGNNFNDYHDKGKITEAMKEKAKKILTYFKFQYDWVAYDGLKGFSKFELDTTKKVLKHVPLQIGVPIPANHAVTMYYLDEEKAKYGRFDHYLPFKRDEAITKDVQFAMRIVVTPILPEEPPKKPDYNFAMLPVFGTRGELVKKLQEVLIYEGFLKKGLNTGYFGQITQNALDAYLAKYKNEMIITHLGKKYGKLDN